jgi:hypothetical protein
VCEVAARKANRWPYPDSRCQTAQCYSFPRRALLRPGLCVSFAGAFTFASAGEPTGLWRQRPSRQQQFRPPDEGWMERRQAHSFFRSRLRRATTLSRGDRDLSRRSTVAVFGCGPTKPAPGSGTGAAATARATPTRLGGRGPDLPRCGSRRSAGRHSPLRLQDRLRRRPLMSEDGNQYNSTSFRSQHLNSNRSHNLTLCMDQTSASTPRPDRRHPC